MTYPISRYVDEVAKLREDVATYERLTRDHQRYLGEQVSNCLAVTREIAHRLLVIESQLRGE